MVLRIFWGGRVTLGGGGLALFSFFLLPYLNVGSLDSLTGWGIASGIARFVPATDSDLSSRMLVLIWLIPLLAVVTGILGFMLTARHAYGEARPARGAAIGVTMSALLAVLCMLLPISGLVAVNGLKSSFGIGSAALARFVGFGYWLTILGMLVALAGGVIALSGARDQEAY